MSETLTCALRSKLLNVQLAASMLEKSNSPAQIFAQLKRLARCAKLCQDEIVLQDFSLDFQRSFIRIAGVIVKSCPYGNLRLDGNFVSHCWKLKNSAFEQVELFAVFGQRQTLRLGICAYVVPHHGEGLGEADGSHCFAEVFGKLKLTECEWPPESCGKFVKEVLPLGSFRRREGNLHVAIFRGVNSLRDVKIKVLPVYKAIYEKLNRQEELDLERW